MLSLTSKDFRMENNIKTGIKDVLHLWTFKMPTLR
jgi:hypothetical protein